MEVQGGPGKGQGESQGAQKRGEGVQGPGTSRDLQGPPGTSRGLPGTCRGPPGPSLDPLAVHHTEIMLESCFLDGYNKSFFQCFFCQRLSFLSFLGRDF